MIEIKHRISGKILKKVDSDKLRGANLQDADLHGADLPIYCKWAHSVVDGKAKIGCETRTPDEWQAFLDSDEVIKTPRNSEEFKQIARVIRAYIAYLKD